MTRSKTETVKTPGGEVTLRPLTVSELATALKSHGPTIFAIFDKAVDDLITADNFDGLAQDTLSIALAVMQESPSFVAHIIAQAADEANAKGLEVVRKLPLGLQLELYKKAAAITMSSQESPRKFLQDAVRLARASDSSDVQH